MNALTQRLHLGRTPDGDNRWDDTDVEDVASALAVLAKNAEAADAPGSTATRAAVLGAFAANQAERAGWRHRARRPAARAGFQPATILIAAVLLAATSVGAVSAAAAGGPLYSARVDLEALFLPASPPDRVRAELDRLDRRVAEALAAVRAGDDAAAEAALSAYAQIARQAVAAQVATGSADVALAQRVRVQLREIATMGGEDPGLASLRAQVAAAAGWLVATLESGTATGPGPSTPSGPSSPNGVKPPFSTPGAAGSQQQPPATPGPAHTMTSSGPNIPAGTGGGHSPDPGISAQPTSPNQGGKSPAPTARPPAATATAPSGSAGAPGTGSPGPAGNSPSPTGGHGPSTPPGGSPGPGSTGGNAG